MTIQMRRSTGNLFRDLGFGPAEAEKLRVRADLMIELSKLIRSRRLSRAKAAKLFGVSQRRVNDLTHGRIERLSVDTLVAMLVGAGVHIQLVVDSG